MEEKAYQQVDDLFAQIRLQLLKLRESEPVTTEKLKSLLTQMEDCVESLVVDSLKLQSLESKPKRPSTAVKKSPKKAVGK